MLDFCFLVDHCKDIRKNIQSNMKHKTAFLFEYGGHTMDHFLPCWCLLLILSVTEEVDIP